MLSQISDQNAATHRMSKREIRRGAVRHQHFADEGCQIIIILTETSHVIFISIAQAPLRSSLSAPVERGNREAALPKVSHGLEITLDEITPALQEANGALQSLPLAQQRIAQPPPVGGSEEPALGAIGNTVARIADESRLIVDSGGDVHAPV